MSNGSGLLRKFRHRWFLALGALPALGMGCDGTVVCDDETVDASGLATCEDGTLYRPAAFTCDKLGPATSGQACMSDEHCAANGAPAAYCACTPEGGVCSQTFCRSDADCEEPYACATVFNSAMLACQTADDECLQDADCSEDGWCAYDGTRRYCEYPCQVDCPVDGRPFLVADENRRASVASRGDWCGSLMPQGSECVASQAERAALGEHWTEVGLMEHASIAAFARLAMQLLSLGAPPSLIDRATRAMADERRHATFAFGLASRYLGEPVGPGRVDIQGALAESDLAAVVRLAIREGCVGETSAAWVMRDGATACNDSSLREALLSIAEDELGHAELAWATLAWALEVGGTSVRGVIEQEIASLRGRAPVAAQAAEPLARFGVKSEARFRALRELTIERIVLPLLEEALHEEGAEPLERALPA